MVVNETGFTLGVLHINAKLPGAATRARVRRALSGILYLYSLFDSYSRENQIQILFRLNLLTQMFYSASLHRTLCSSKFSAGGMKPAEA